AVSLATRVRVEERVDRRVLPRYPARRSSDLAPQVGLERVRGGEVGGVGIPRHVSIAAAVHRDGPGLVVAIPAQVGGVDERGTRGVQLRYEGIISYAVVWLERVCGGGGGGGGG